MHLHARVLIALTASCALGACTQAPPPLGSSTVSETAAATPPPTPALNVDVPVDTAPAASAVTEAAVDPAPASAAESAAAEAPAPASAAVPPALKLTAAQILGHQHAAEHGSGDSAYRLYEYYTQVSKDPAAADTYLHLAAKAHFPAAMSTLGQNLITSDDTVLAQQGRTWLEAAAKAGDAAAARALQAATKSGT